MPSRTTAAAIAITFAGALEAQALNAYQLTPDPDYNSAASTTRVGGSKSGEVECLVDFASALFHGGGSVDATTCTLAGLEYLIQDDDMYTVDSYRLVVRRAVAPNGLPDGAATGVIMRTGAIQLPPPNPPGSGPVVWLITTTFQNEITVPCENGFWLGLVLLPGVGSDVTWAVTSNTYDGSTNPPTGDNPRASGFTVHAGRVDQPAGSAFRSATQRTLAISALTSAAVLNAGNIDPSKSNYKSYGLGGAYPGIKAGAGRDDGLYWRVTDNASKGGLAVAFLGGVSFSNGLMLGGFSGAIWITPPVISLGQAAIPNAAPSRVEVLFAPPGRIPAIVGLEVFLSGVTLSPTLTNPRFTNAQRIRW